MEVIESGLKHDVLLDRNQEGVLCLRRGRDGWEVHPERFDESRNHKASSSIRFASFWVRRVKERSSGS